MKESKLASTFNSIQLVIYILITLTGFFVQACGSIEQSQKPDYPLFISSLENAESYSSEELTKIALWFDHSNSSMGSDQIKKLRSLNSDFVALSPVNSSYSSSNTAESDFHYFETKYRHAISMYKCADLQESITEQTTDFILTPLSDFELEKIAEGVKVKGAETSGLSKGIRQSGKLSLKASTVEGKYSDSKKSVEKYVTWIQIGDEYMRIDKWDSTTRRITVSRGFDGTKAVSHSSGSPVLSPVYIGVLGHTWSGYFPGGFQHMLRYALRIDHKDVHAFKASKVINNIRRNQLDGVWLDIMCYNFFNQSNMHGEQVIPWNFEKKAPYTSDDYRDNQHRKAGEIRKIVETELAKKVILLGNNFSNSYFPEQGGGKKLLESTEIHPTPLNGFILEGIGGEYLHNNFRTGESMIAMLQQIIDMEEKGYSAFCSSDNNKVRRAHTPEEVKLKNQHETYGYAAFLMAVKSGGSIKYGIDCYREPSLENSESILQIHPQYFYGIGKPLQSIRYDQISSYLLSGTQTYCREFENAFVFLNISSDQTDVINLEKIERIGKALNDPENGQSIKMLEIAPHTGIILLK